MIVRIMLATKTHSKRSLACGVQETHTPSVGCMRRVHRKEGLRAFNARRIKREMDRGKAFLSVLLQRLKSIRGGSEDIATLNETPAAGKTLGVPCVIALVYLFWTVNLANTVTHKPFCKIIQTDVLQTRQVRYSKASGPSATTTRKSFRISTDPKTQKFRKDGELKKMLGNHPLPVRGGIISVMIPPDATRSFSLFMTWATC